MESITYMEALTPVQRGNHVAVVGNNEVRASSSTGKFITLDNGNVGDLVRILKNKKGK